MAKFGYTCKCNWRLNRGNLTRKQYADRKRAHAYGVEPNFNGCRFLAEELARTKRKQAA